MWEICAIAQPSLICMYRQTGSDTIASNLDAGDCDVCALHCVPPLSNRRIPLASSSSPENIPKPGMLHFRDRPRLFPHTLYRSGPPPILGLARKPKRKPNRYGKPILKFVDFVSFFFPTEESSREANRARWLEPPPLTALKSRRTTHSYN